MGNDPIALAYPPDDPCPAVYTTNVSTGGCVIGDRPRYVVNARYEVLVGLFITLINVESALLSSKIPSFHCLSYTLPTPAVSLLQQEIANFHTSTVR